MEAVVMSPATMDISPAAQWLPTTLQLPEGMRYEEWEQVGATLSTMERAVNWWIGDWLGFGERAFGEKYAAAVQETGRRKESLMNLASVAGRIPPAARRASLSWSSHRAVAYLDPAERERILDDAEREGWGSREVTEAVKKLSQQVPQSVPPKSHHSGEIVTDDELREAPGQSDLLAELEHADRELRELRTLAESLQTSDQAKEIASLHTRYQQLEGRLRQAITEANEAKRQAKYQGEMLRKLRKLLGVERDRELLPRLMEVIQ